VSALAIEFVLIRQELTLANARRLLVVDGVFGTSAGLVLVVGLMRVFMFEKGGAYYWSSHAFLTKLGAFILVGILSAVPTMAFLSWRKSIRAGQAPTVEAGKLRTIRLVMYGEFAGVAVILLMAAIMARGGWV
jgi:putative membrane protein